MVACQPNETPIGSPISVERDWKQESDNNDKADYLAVEWHSNNSTDKTDSKRVPTRPKVFQVASSSDLNCPLTMHDFVSSQATDT